MLAGPFVVAVLLLVAGAALELHRPVATVRAMRAMGLPASPLAVRSGAVAALMVCAGALATGGGVFAAMVAVAYLLFAAFVGAALLRRVPLSSCGCFGADDTPPTVTHLVVDLTAAGVATAVALGGDGAVSVPDGSVFLQAAFVFLVAIATWLAYTVLTLLPRLGAAARRSSEASA